MVGVATAVSAVFDGETFPSISTPLACSSRILTCSSHFFIFFYAFQRVVRIKIENELTLHQSSTPLRYRALPASARSRSPRFWGCDF
jgi:hypothetical protein